MLICVSIKTAIIRSVKSCLDGGYSTRLVSLQFWCLLTVCFNQAQRELYQVAKVCLDHFYYWCVVRLVSAGKTCLLKWVASMEDTHLTSIYRVINYLYIKWNMVSMQHLIPTCEGFGCDRAVINSMLHHLIRITSSLSNQSFFALPATSCFSLNYYCTYLC